ncbi:MAG: hypothetical protein QOI66_414, partial [Myxococcales bacterium]|nr:hypothetical protein [Myxococcales bacterium]
MTLKPALSPVARRVLYRIVSAIARRSPSFTSLVTLLLSLSLSLSSACVIPLAPEFEDPPAAQNIAPIITDSFPINGAVVSTRSSADFRVTVFDPNSSDDLHVRWIADYPPYGPNTRLLRSPDLPHGMTASFQQTDITIDCINSNLALGLAQHQIMMIVADQLFLP